MYSCSGVSVGLMNGSPVGSQSWVIWGLFPQAAEQKPDADVCANSFQEDIGDLEHARGKKKEVFAGFSSFKNRSQPASRCILN